MSPTEANLSIYDDEYNFDIADEIMRVTIHMSRQFLYIFMI